LVLSELFLNITSCNGFHNSAKFKFIHKIGIIQKKFLLLFNLLQCIWGPDSGRGLCIPGVMSLFVGLLLFVAQSSRGVLCV